MKVFVPMSDSLVESGALESEKLVPFNPDFLTEFSSELTLRSKGGIKPDNWIIESDYAAACSRLGSRSRLVTA